MSARRAFPPDPAPDSRARGRKDGPRWLHALLALYALFLVAIAGANAVGAESWWWSSLNLYLPQWIWALPGVPLLAASIRCDRRQAWVPLACLFWVAGPLMGLRGAFGESPGPGGVRLRVMTYNVEWCRRPREVVAEIRRADPDVLLLQDAGDGMRGPLGALLRDWDTREEGQYVTACRLPFRLAESVPQTASAPRPARQRCRLLMGRSRATLLNAHLLSPRDALASLKYGLAAGIPELRANVAVRMRQAADLAAEVAAETDPVILGGDLNVPPPSTAFQMLLHPGLRDAFAAAGRGYGYTYGHSLRTRHPFARLDHLLLSGQWRILKCRTGGKAGSDHCPVIADVWLDAGPAADNQGASRP